MHILFAPLFSCFCEAALYAGVLFMKALIPVKQLACYMQLACVCVNRQHVKYYSAIVPAAWHKDTLRSKRVRLLLPR